MNIQRRPATASDEFFLRTLHKAAYHDVVVRQFGGWDDALQYNLFTAKWNPAQSEIVEVDGKAAGCLSVTNDPGRLFIAELQLLPEYQGRGIGSELMKTEIARARQMQKTLRLQVLHKNERARAFYERLGFVVDGTTDRHFEMVLPVLPKAEG